MNKYILTFPYCLLVKLFRENPSGKVAFPNHTQFYYKVHANANNSFFMPIFFSSTGKEVCKFILKIF